jgi:hypothetical protein
MPQLTERFDSAVEFVNQAVLLDLREAFRERREIAMHSLILARKTPDGEPISSGIGVVIVPHAHHSRVQTRFVQQACVERCEAIGIVFIYEGYYAELEQGETEKSLPGGSVSQHPNSVECVCAMLEHREGTALWRIPILRPEGETPRLGEVVTVVTEGRSLGGFFSGYVRPNLHDVNVN